MKTSDILKTATAKCHDCYRCVRACPVKAIGIKDGQAYIDDDRCVLCGTCVRECPQKAKIFRNDVDKVKDLIKNHQVVASIAPSFAALFDGWKSMRIPSALRKLGFVKVEETSVGADMVSIATNDYILKNNDGTICSACPASVLYVEKHKSEMVESLLPICSPMIAHAKSIKSLDSDVKVVFIGPCILK